MDTLLKQLETMSLGEIAGNAVLILAIFSVFFEVVPVKISPLSSLLRWAGDRLNGDLKKHMDEISDTIDKNEIDRIRWEILDFSNSCRNKRRHTKDEFEHIIELNVKYHEILKRRGMTNGIIDLEYDYIVRLYKRCLEKNSFLPSGAPDDEDTCEKCRLDFCKEG